MKYQQKFIRFLIVLIILSIHSSYSQTKKIDSLKKLIQTGQRDTTMVNNLNSLSKEILNSKEFTESIKFSKQAIELSKQLGYLSGEAYAEKNMGIVFYFQGDYQSVLDHWNKSLEIFESIKDSEGISNLTSNLGAVYQSQGSKYAIDFYLRSLGLAEKIQDSSRIVVTLLNIGRIHSDKIKDYNKALEYYNQIPRYLPALNEPQITTTYFMAVGEIYLMQGKFEYALKFYQDAMPISINTLNYANNLTQLGIVEFKMGHSSKAIAFLNQAYQNAKKNNQQFNMVKALIELGKVYQNNDFPNAIRAFNEAESIASTINAKLELKDIYEGLTEVYAIQGDHISAFKYQSQLIAYKDSIFNLKSDDEISGLEFDFNLSEKEIEILQLKAKGKEFEAKRQKNVLQFTVGLLIVVFILAIGVLNRYRYVKKTNKIIEEEKKRSESLLLNILPTEIAEELKLKGSVDARDRELVTILFTDFQNFTQTTEELTAKELIDEINNCFAAFDNICDKFGVEKIKTIGDSYMAAGGVPLPSDNSVKNTVSAALEMQEFIKNRTEMKMANNEIPFKMRVGINTGSVIAGIVGVKKFQYDIWGDPVNIASRMESNGEVGKVNISQLTYELIKDDKEFTFENRGKIVVKGKGEMEMYFVERAKT